MTRILLVTTVALCGASKYVMAEPSGFEMGQASVYWEDRFVATGARFDGRKLAAAHPSLPLGTCLMVRYRGRETPVVVNDRGPCTTDHCRLHMPARVRQRVLDMTPAVARELRFPGLGTVTFWKTPCLASR